MFAQNRKTMKRFFTLGLILLASVKLMAQGAYDDLRVIYVEDDYEKCYKKCMKYLVFKE